MLFEAIWHFLTTLFSFSNTVFIYEVIDEPRTNVELSIAFFWTLDTSFGGWSKVPMFHSCVRLDIFFYSKNVSCFTSNSVWNYRYIWSCWLSLWWSAVFQTLNMKAVVYVVWNITYWDIYFKCHPRMFTGGINATVLGLVCSLCLGKRESEGNDFFKGEVQIYLM